MPSPNDHCNSIHRTAPPSTAHVSIGIHLYDAVEIGWHISTGDYRGIISIQTEAGMIHIHTTDAGIDNLRERLASAQSAMFPAPDRAYGIIDDGAG
jgi:hypothetical protein